MKFSYVALTGDNKKMTGVLEAESQNVAQDELHKMGVAIITVNEISDEEYEKLKNQQEEARVAKGIQTFSFLATDPSGKEVEGTIDAADDYSAYKRLRSEYKFQVNEIYLSSASEDKKQQAKGMLEGFESRLQSEIEEHKTTEEKGEDEEDAVSKELVKEIDNIIINSKKLLEAHKELFSNDLFREIETTLGELERVRTSNNVKHITEVSNNLYDLIGNPDRAESETADENYKSILNKLGDSALVKKEFDFYKRAIQATGAKKLFKNIAEKLKSLTESKKDETGKPPGALEKTKNKIHSLLESFTKQPKKKTEVKKPPTPLGVLFEKLGDYLKTSSPVLKKARKKELVKAFKAVFGKKAKAKDGKSHETPASAEDAKNIMETAEPPREKVKKQEPETPAKTKKGSDFTGFFVELDSFMGWLLCFYIIYFFLVGFSLEKNIGLSPDFVLKTLKTPLILNITIFLLIIHFTLRTRNVHFRYNLPATLFLIFLSLGIYAALIVNF